MENEFVTIEEYKRDIRDLEDQINGKLATLQELAVEANKAIVKQLKGYAPDAVWDLIKACGVTPSLTP